MEDIKEIKDLFQFILQADDIGHDSSFGSDIIIPVYDISPEEFLAFAENAISSGTKEGLVNATSNLKRALAVSYTHLDVYKRQEWDVAIYKESPK